MRILLDECVDEHFADALAGYEVLTVAQLGWKGAKNGVLLAQAVEGGIEAFVTVDRNLMFQQNVPRYAIGIVVMRAKSNRLRDLLPLAPAVRQALASIKTGEVRFIGD